jgi:hypothetical protein
VIELIISIFLHCSNRKSIWKTNNREFDRTFTAVLIHKAYILIVLIYAERFRYETV